MVTSFKRSHACTATLSVTNPAAGHHNPRLHWRLLDTHRQVWVSLMWEGTQENEDYTGEHPPWGLVVRATYWVP